MAAPTVDPLNPLSPIPLLNLFGRTSWYMDIEVYLKDPATQELFTNDALRFEYGPYRLPIGGLTTLETFLATINNKNYSLANPTSPGSPAGRPFVYVYATPYFFKDKIATQDGTNPPLGGAGSLLPAGPGPYMRKLGGPGPAPVNQDQAMTNAMGSDYYSQIFVRYDISIYDLDVWKQNFAEAFATAEEAAGNEVADSDTLEYYGFKIYWRTGPYITTQVVGDPEGPYATIGYEQNLDTVALDLPYGPSTGFKITVQDDSPLPPVPRIAPYMGLSNKLLIMLNSNTGLYKARPVAILPGDLEKIALIYLNQQGVVYTPAEVKTLINDPLADEADYAIEYKKDDPPIKFQVFRMTDLPTSYEDFDTGQNPHATLISNVSYGKHSDGVSLIDDIEPNKKYYYCFRTLDTHDNISNPTHVFEVEMMDNDGQVYIILKTIQFSVGPKRSYHKSGRRFIYLEPSLHNLTFETPDLLVDPAVPGVTFDSLTPESIPPDNLLGDSTDPAFDPTKLVWDETYKIRVTSRKTSRKFDLNIRFKNTGVKNPEG